MKQCIEMIMKETSAQVRITLILKEAFSESDCGPIFGTILAIVATIWTLAVWPFWIIFRILWYALNPEKALDFSRRRVEHIEWTIDQWESR